MNGVVEINVGSSSRPLVTFGAKNDQRPASAASDTASVSDGKQIIYLLFIFRLLITHVLVQPILAFQILKMKKNQQQGSKLNRR